MGKPLSTECRALGGSRQHDRHYRGRAAGWRHTLTSHRGVQRRDPGLVPVA